MRKVSIKALYKNLSKELDLLPFQITRKGVPFATVLGLDQNPETKKESRPTIFVQDKYTDGSYARSISEVPDPFFRPMPKSGKAKK